LIIWFKGNAKAIRFTFQTALLKESKGWFPNSLEFGSQPFFCVDKGKKVMYILASSKQISFNQSQYPRSRNLSRSEKNRAGISELKSGSASLFVF
jgi:hypothetical protein